ncbi:MAG: hypothetical protein EPN21_06200 [Methylococcaceae bacterium]|nr:MAG: hypothetical protein EPN21_06200 [Methylococcaceae bacterium]
MPILLQPALPRLKQAGYRYALYNSLGGRCGYFHIAGAEESMRFNGLGQRAAEHARRWQITSRFEPAHKKHTNYPQNNILQQIDFYIKN